MEYLLTVSRGHQITSAWSCLMVIGLPGSPSFDSDLLQGWTYKVEASFLEIYNETIRDLLVSSKDAKNVVYDIKLVDNKKNDTYVTNLKVTLFFEFLILVL